MTVKVYSPVLPSVEVFGAHEGVASATGINQTVSLTFTPTEGTLVVVPYGDPVSQLQLEVGPTPSSHIPTEDAEVTRAADIMTVPAANMPWPEPVVIGEELVTNGTFDSDVSGWTAFSGATISLVSGALRITSGAAGYGRAVTPISVILGKVYDISVEKIAGTSFNFGIANNSDGSGNLGSSALNASRLTWVATKTGVVYLNVTVQTPNPSNTVDVDNISVKEINPLAVSIQMDGTMTYADEDLQNTVDFIRWLASGGDYVLTRLDTRGSDTGQLLFRQSASTVLDESSGPANSYSPGINVPFNIASRHGSTFINGAVDGVALTANTTPTALPDLSTTDFEIAPTFMGNISKLRVWADDIGDDGIEEASS